MQQTRSRKQFNKFSDRPRYNPHNAEHHVNAEEHHTQHQQQQYGGAMELRKHQSEKINRLLAKAKENDTITVKKDED